MDGLFDKAKEMAQDPAMQERLKNEAQKRFGMGGASSPDHGGGESINRSNERSEGSSADEAGIDDGMPSHQGSHEGRGQHSEADDQATDTFDTPGTRY